MTTIETPPTPPRAAVLPDGKKLADYDGHPSWSSKRWAWEFLRRNETFIDACEELATFKTKSKNREARRLVALLFGLDRFKPYSESYSTGKLPKFAAVDIYLFANLTQDEPVKMPATTLAKGEVVIRFNLIPSLADERALRAQVKRAGSELRARRRKLLQSMPGLTSFTETVGQRRIYIRHLRILDLLRTQPTKVDVLRVINDDNETPGHELRNDGGKADIAKAQQYAEVKYLAFALGKVKKPRKGKA